MNRLTDQAIIKLCHDVQIGTGGMDYADALTKIAEELTTRPQGVVELLEIPEKDGLDAINVYWHNVGPGKGYVTITCWGSAWTSWFGGMGDRTIQQFFAAGHVGYFVNKLGITQHLKQSKRNEAYLARIIVAVKEALKSVAPPFPHEEEKETGR
jgi:hypothetical protein